MHVSERDKQGRTQDRRLRVETALRMCLHVFDFAARRSGPRMLGRAGTDVAYSAACQARIKMAEMEQGGEEEEG